MAEEITTIPEPDNSVLGGRSHAFSTEQILENPAPARGSVQGVHYPASVNVCATSPEGKNKDRC